MVFKLISKLFLIFYLIKQFFTKILYNNIIIFFYLKLINIINIIYNYDLCNKIYKYI